MSSNMTIVLVPILIFRLFFLSFSFAQRFSLTTLPLPRGRTSARFPWTQSQSILWRMKRHIIFFLFVQTGDYVYVLIFFRYSTSQYFALFFWNYNNDNNDISVNIFFSYITKCICVERKGGLSLRWSLLLSSVFIAFVQCFILFFLI